MGFACTLTFLLASITTIRYVISGNIEYIAIVNQYSDLDKGVYFLGGFAEGYEDTQISELISFTPSDWVDVDLNKAEDRIKLKEDLASNLNVTCIELCEPADDQDKLNGTAQDTGNAVDPGDAKKK